MEEDIKILEELIEIGLEDFTDITITDRQAQAIQNLIARNKEYEKQLDLDYVDDNYIPKSKVKEIIYPSPENPIELEIQNSKMYKELEKLVED